MATVAPSSDQAVDLLQNLSLDSQTKTTGISEPKKKPSVDSGDPANGQVQLFDGSVTPSLQDFYLPGGYPSTAYYYGSYDGNTNEWDEYTRYVSPDGVEMTPGVYGDNGSVIYHHGYGYAPYSPYSPATGSSVPTLGHDVHQLYGAHQHYQYPTTPYFQQQPTPITGSQAPKGGISTTAGAAGQVSLSVDTAVNGNSASTGGGGAVKGNSNNNISAPVRSAYQSSSFNGNNGSYGRGAALPIAASGYQDPRFNYNYNNNNYDGIRSPIPWIDGPVYSDGYHHNRNLTTSSITSSSISNNNNGNSLPTSRNQHLHHSQLMGMHHPRPTTDNVYMNRIYSNKLYGGHNGNSFRSGLVYGSNYNSNSAYASRTNGGLGWLAVDNKFKSRGRGHNGFFGYYGNENVDGLNELNRGPRAKSNSLKNQKDSFTPIASLVMQEGQKNNISLAGINDKKDDDGITTVIPDRDQYNRVDFPDNYEDAMFFIIKSYSEDDVHKSIKYNVWSSTQNGNKKLDAAYQEARQKLAACPVFLFFSVNTSGQFVGVAEMVAPVDFNKSVEYWQQDKWIGCFPVKWHIVKDVPNTLLKHITLENNENKPVTNSRDTQEVKLEQGLQLLKIFKGHCSKQCILDDFGFYADRQKRIQEKKAKQQQFHKQVWEGNATDGRSKEGANIELKIQKSAVESTSPFVESNGDIKVSDNDASSMLVVNLADEPKAVVVEKKVVLG